SRLGQEDPDEEPCADISNDSPVRVLLGVCGYTPEHVVDPETGHRRPLHGAAGERRRAPVSSQLRPLPQPSGVNFTSRSKGCSAAHARPGNVERRGRAVDSEISCALIAKLYQARDFANET